MALYWITLALLPIPALAGMTGALAAWVTAILTSAVRFLGSFDCISLWTKQANLVSAAGWILLMLGISHLTFLRGGKRLAAGVMGAWLLVASLVPLPHRTVEYIQFSEGNADAALLYDKDHVMVIDTGESGYNVSRYLHHRRLSVDVLILTHLHADHAGGVEALLADGIPVRTCYIPWGADTLNVQEDMLLLLEQLAQTGTEIIEVARGDVISMPSGSMTVLWPERDRVRPGMDANSYAMTLQAQVNGTTMLLTGDLDGVYEMYAAVPADVLKAAHHGSAGSSSVDFLKVVAPQTVLISTGRKERLQMMQEKAGGAQVFSTDQCGALTIRLEENAYTITTFK